MEEARLIVAGQPREVRGQWPTHAKDPNVYECGRRYRFPKPGQVFRYSSDTASRPKVTENGIAFGLVVLEDWIYQVASQNQTSEGPTIYETKIEKAAVIARDLARRFGKLGVLMIQGETPTPAEIEMANRNRRAFAQHMIQRDEHEIKRKRRPEHSLAAIAWAEEYNYRLSDLTEIKQVEQTPTDNRIPCPECAELVQPQAKVCIHCQMKYGKPLAELLEEEDAAAMAAPEVEGVKEEEQAEAEPVKRRRGRPRNVLGEA